MINRKAVLFSNKLKPMQELALRTLFELRDMSFHCEGVPIDDIGIRPCDREQLLEEMQELSELHIVKIKDGVLSFDDMDALSKLVS